MAIKTISDFKSQLRGGGARPNLFNVQLTAPPPNVDSLWDADKFQFICKAASLTAQNVASIDIPFRGRIFKVAGDRTIDVWTVTIINDEDFIFRRAFEEWSEQIVRLSNNMGTTRPSEYMVSASVQQLGRGATPSSVNNGTPDDNATILNTYEFVDIWPTTVAPIDLSYDSGDTIEEYTVDFAVNSFRCLNNPSAA